MTEYGKFESAEELLKGYTELEKSFTQKCQQLSALEKQLTENGGRSEQSSPQQTSSSACGIETVPVKDADGTLTVNAETESGSEERIRQYLAEHPDMLNSLLKDHSEQQHRLPKVMKEGGNVSMALPSRPKTIKEASVMAKELFRNS
ncbi:MAG: hypothetical protein NC099_04330 [Corallococcus sp.]|nr:hypothetical protein [Bacillota bacterium]MCM1533864.1 hypothetical protein [Corallococcus sp.]